MFFIPESYLHDNRPERPITSWLAKNLTWPTTGKYHSKPFFPAKPLNVSPTLGACKLQAPTIFDQPLTRVCAQCLQVSLVEVWPSLPVKPATIGIQTPRFKLGFWPQDSNPEPLWWKPYCSELSQQPKPLFLLKWKRVQLAVLSRGHGNLAVI